MSEQTPPPVMGFYDIPLWEGIRAKAMRLQACLDCGEVQYPPAPVCAACLSPRLEWRAVCGRGRIVSWVVFHRSYLPAYPAPYNVIAVRLEEGPVMISNLEPPLPPEGDWIGTPVRLVYADGADGAVLPRFVQDGGSTLRET